MLYPQSTSWCAAALNPILRARKSSSLKPAVVFKAAFLITTSTHWHQHHYSIKSAQRSGFGWTRSILRLIEFKKTLWLHGSGTVVYRIYLYIMCCLGSVFWSIASEEISEVRRGQRKGNRNVLTGKKSRMLMVNGQNWTKEGRWEQDWDMMERTESESRGGRKIERRTRGILRGGGEC